MEEHWPRFLHFPTVTKQVLMALSFLRRLQIIHGAIKPDNLLLTADGEVRLIDFGNSSPEDAPGRAGDLRHQSRNSCEERLRLMPLISGPSVPAAGFYQVTVKKPLVTPQLHQMRFADMQDYFLQEIEEKWGDGLAGVQASFRAAPSNGGRLRWRASWPPKSSPN